MLRRGAAVVLVACGGQHAVAPPPPHNPAPVASVAPAPVVAKVKWVPVVSSNFRTYDSVSLGTGLTLFVGSAGQRWLVRSVRAPIPGDWNHLGYELTGAPMMARETIVAVRKKGDGAFFFVDATGATYRAKEPLGDLVDAHKPSMELREVAMGKSAIVALTTHDTVVRSVDDGATFVPVVLPKTLAVPVTIGGNAHGELAILAAPGKIIASTDDGLNFAIVPTGGYGATAIVRPSREDALVFEASVGMPVKGGSSDSRYRNAILHAGSVPSIEVTNNGGIYGLNRPANDDEHLHFGYSIMNHRGVLHDQDHRYVEVQDPRSGTGVLEARALDHGKVTRVPIAGTDGCRAEHLAGSGSLLAMMCRRARQIAGVSTDEFQYFRSADFGKTFQPDVTALVGSDNTPVLALSSKGTLFTVAKCGSLARCLMFALPGQKTLTPAIVPAGSDVFRVLPTADGNRVYALADADDGTRALLVSRDGGKSFTAKPAPNEIDRGTDLAFDEVTSTVAIFRIRETMRRFATRDDGATWENGELPTAVTDVSFAGARGLATTERGYGFETLDLGATWSKVSLPRSPTGNTLVACSPSGCLLDEVAMREGWELQTAADVKPLAVPDLPASKVKHLPPVDCASEGDPIELGTIGEPELDPVKGVTFAVVSEATDGPIELAKWTGKALARVQLLDKPKEPSASRNWLNGDGAIALRVARGDGKTTTDVEVAWWSASTNKVFRGKLEKATTSLGSAASPSAVGAIVPGFGLYVRTSVVSTLLYLVKEGGAVSKLSFQGSLPIAKELYARRTAKGIVFTGQAHDASTAPRAAFLSKLEGDTIETHSWALWPRGESYGKLAFAGDRFVVSMSGNATTAPRAFALPWTDATLEAPEPTEIPFGSAEVPACVSDGPRVELPWAAGFRTPYTIQEGKRTLYFATYATTIRHSNKTCLRGSLAALYYARTPTEWLVVPADDPAHGFLLTKGKGNHVLTRVSCKKSEGPLPKTFQTAVGFRE